MASTAQVPTPETPQTRPQTHKPRGICRYYNAPRGCFAGDKCKFLHGEPTLNDQTTAGEGTFPTSTPPAVLLTPYDQAKVCRHYVKGFCKRGETCWFRHVLPSTSKVASDGKESQVGQDDDSEATLCSICLERPVTYGLLEGCNHIFCIACIKQWRDVKNKNLDVVSTNNKKCPMCRTSSNFITPSSMFVQHGTPGKQSIIEKYKDSMARVQCRYFQRSRNQEPMCPFGKDCFYRHEKADGTLHVFKEGTSYWMQRYEARRRGPNRDNVFLFSQPGLGANLFRLPFNLRDPLFLDLLNPITANAAETGNNANRNGAAQQPQSQGAGMGNVSVSLGDMDRDFLRPEQGLAHGAVAVGANIHGPTSRHGRTWFSQAQGLRTVQEIGRSLQALTQAMDTGASLDRLGENVQNLRERLSQEAPAGEGNVESMERLQSLADQMFASIGILRGVSETRPNALPREPSAATATAAGPTTDNFAMEARSRGVPAVRGAESDDDMPDLQSISNSSEDELSDDPSDDYAWEIDSEDARAHAREARLEHFANIYRRPAGLFAFETAPAGAGAGSGHATPAGSTSRTATVNPPASTAVENSNEYPNDMPGLIDLADLSGSDVEFFRGNAGPYDSSDDGGEWDDGEGLPLRLSDASRQSLAAVTLPPFVTDGRGRVVWTSSGSSGAAGADAESPPAPAPTDAAGGGHVTGASRMATATPQQQSRSPLAPPSDPPSIAGLD